MDNINTFLPIDKIVSNLNLENILNYGLNFIRPISVEGYLDDLLGQQLFIHFLLLIIVISLIILFSLYLIIQTVANNKELILKRFQNRFIIMYFKYQIFLSKISLIVIPCLIILG